MSDPVELRPWQVPREFPGHEVHPAKKLRFLLHWAVLAPSPHNAQPWYFHIEDETLEVHADRTRALAVVDPHDRELGISCGAAIYNIRIAARYFSYEPIVQLLPDKGPADLMALVRLGARRPPSAEEHTMFKAIPRRRTNRGRFDGKPLDENTLHVLERACATDSAWMNIVHDHRSKHDIAELVSEADRAQFHDKRFRRELAAWVHPNRQHTKDGMPGYSHGMGDIASTLGPFMIRNFDLGASTAKKDHEKAEYCPALGLLSTKDDTPLDWLHAGQAMQHVLLHIAAAGLAASYLNQPIQVESLRARVGEIVGAKGHPQVLLRLGHGPEPKPTPRRGVEDVVRV